jgi:branched-chain amino acid transport system ATP-binding protein
MSALLELDNVTVRYGPVTAVRQASLQVLPGEIVTLIGANGSGKTSILRAISRLLKPASGSIVYFGEDIARVPAHLLPRKGLVHVPEGRIIFGTLTVQENLDLAAWWRVDADQVRADFTDVFAMFPRLADRRQQLGGTLSGGEQQMLALARGIMARPRIMLMDEPSMGLAPIVVRSIFAAIQRINEAGTAILLVEQNAHMALSIANRAYVLQTGRIVMSGDAKDLRDDPDIQAAYLG